MNKFGNYTRDQFADMIRYQTTSQVLDLLEAHGVTFKEPIEPAPVGVYRRRYGLDLIYVGPEGRITYVDRWEHGTKPIAFELSKHEGWVHVLDRLAFPVIDGRVVFFDKDGNQVG